MAKRPTPQPFEEPTDPDRPGSHAEDSEFEAPVDTAPRFPRGSMRSWTRGSSPPSRTLSPCVALLWPGIRIRSICVYERDLVGVLDRETIELSS